MSEQVEEGMYSVNGHKFVPETKYDGDVLVECRHCMVRELVEEDDDPMDHLEIMTPECHFEWVRKPDGGFRGIALRNASGFSGRELLSIDEDDEITDRVRIYDNDLKLLRSMLDLGKWESRDVWGEG